MGKKIVLIDGNNIAYRAFYALPPTVATSTGTITNAVYGFTTMLMKLIEDQKPDVIICAFDSKSPTFRHDIFTDYKATRKKMPDELTDQMPLIKEVLEAFNIKSMQMDGFEADDIIATISRIARNKFNEVIIVSSDKDILQLVSDNITVLSIKKGITDIAIFDEEKVEEKFGVEPSQMKDLLALMGDTSDNIPGISGIGPKTAQALIEQFGSIEDIYRNIDNLKNEKLRQLLINNEDAARQSRTLTELKTELDIDEEEVTESNFSNPAFDKIENIFSTLEFNTLKKRIRNIFKARDTAQSEKTMQTASLPDKETSLISQQSRPFKLSIEPAEIKKILDSGVQKIFITLINKTIPEEVLSRKKNFEGLIITDQNCNSYLLTDESLDRRDITVIIKEIIEDNNITKSGFDIKQVWKFLKKKGINLYGKFIDFKILYLLLNPDKSETGLGEIISVLFGSDISPVQTDLQ
ncbi:MAG: hypothetical protein M1409_01550 [Actinobacteria bacterium]|nr:hypothetical protein [Actinomycetota bacterium]